MQINPTEFPLEEQCFFIEGPAGLLEVLTYPAKDLAQGVGIICHPHPLHQGSMTNKVVHTLSRAFHRKRCHAIRFNFRGVGKSEGEFGDSMGEFADLKAILNWSEQVLPNTKIYLAGFSFGAYIAALGAAFYPCHQLFSIAPAVTNQPYQTLRKIDCPWVIIQGEKDEVIPLKEVAHWVSKYQQEYENIKFITMPDASHFFHGQLITLRSLVEQNLIN